MVGLQREAGIEGWCALGRSTGPGQVWLGLQQGRKLRARRTERTVSQQQMSFTDQPSISVQCNSIRHVFIQCLLEHRDTEMKKTRVLPSRSLLSGMTRRKQPWELSRGGHRGPEVQEKEVLVMGGSWCTCSFKFSGWRAPPHSLLSSLLLLRY